jgi:hypothetical protein
MKQRKKTFPFKKRKKERKIEPLLLCRIPGGESWDLGTGILILVRLCIAPTI